MVGVVAAGVVILLFLALGHVQGLLRYAARRFLCPLLFAFYCAAFSLCPEPHPDGLYGKAPEAGFSAPGGHIAGYYSRGITVRGAFTYGARDRSPPWFVGWEFAFAVRLGAIISLAFGLSVSFYEGMRYKLQAATLELRTRTLEEERARKLLAEARLSSLESRIHPHFLFNTLNSISALIPQDPQRAGRHRRPVRVAIALLANASQTSLLPWSKNSKWCAIIWSLSRRALALAALSSIIVPEPLLAVAVPPLSIQTLVENSVKHVAAPRPQGGEIRIEARSAGPDRIDIEVIDDGPGFARENIPAGHGLENLIARLTLLFGPGARLEVDCGKAHSTVRLSFPRGEVNRGEAHARSLARLSG